MAEMTYYNKLDYDKKLMDVTPLFVELSVDTGRLGKTFYIANGLSSSVGWGYAPLTESEWPDLEYKIGEDGEWSTINYSDLVNNVFAITLIKKEAGTRVYFRGQNDTINLELHSLRFSLADQAFKKIGGNTMSLLDKNLNRNDVPAYCFRYLFADCGYLEDASQLSLPANNLSNNCYAQMFQGDGSLQYPPELPASNLADSCYYRMFGVCSSLKYCPELKAATMKTDCYSYMFQRCISITEPPVLNSTVLADGCYSGMFMGCKKLEYCPELPATMLANSCYSHMFSWDLNTFERCEKITECPELPATILARACYQDMFYECSNLTTAPSILPAKTIYPYSYGYMFAGCEKLENAPEIMIENYSGEYNHFHSMFSGCELIDEIKVHFTNWGNLSFQYWLNGVAENGTFICPEELPEKRQQSPYYEGIPASWTIQRF